MQLAMSIEQVIAVDMLVFLLLGRTGSLALLRASPHKVPDSQREENKKTINKNDSSPACFDTISPDEMKTEWFNVPRKAD